jgi:catechol 2,3-dioxygenase-like lactoylglutathione lyase family enzyme
VQLTDGVHHLTFLTEDMERLVAFYVRVFEAELTLDMTEEGARHVFLRVGPNTVLHPSQLLEGTSPPPPAPMFTRGAGARGCRQRRMDARVGRDRLVALQRLQARRSCRHDAASSQRWIALVGSAFLNLKETI